MISAEDIPYLSQQIAADRPGALKSLIEKRLYDSTRSLLGEMQSFARENNTRLFFIIPEFNLAHWRQAHNTAGVCTLEQDQLDSYRQCCLNEIMARKKNDHHELSELAAQMIALDPFNPHGYRVKADALNEMGLHAEAKEFYRRELDCSIIFKFILKPRITTAIQEAIEKSCIELGIGIIDSRQIFSAEGNGIPAREVFMDYCHLSVRGIQLTMAHTCATLLHDLWNIQTDKAVLKQKALNITAPSVTQGWAHLMAAIHHAHHGQPYDMIQYHCRHAIGLYPGIAECIRLYTEMAVQKLPNFLCKQYVELLKRAQKSRNKSELLHAPGKKLADFDLVDAMLSVLGPEEEAQRKKINTLRNQQHGVNNFSHINLLQSYYSASGHRFSLVDLLQPVQYFREVEKSSRFRLVAQPGTVIRLKLICRVPLAGEINIAVNERALPPTVVGTTWTTIDIELPAQLIDREINFIDIHWPLVSRKHLFHRLSGMNDLVQLINPVSGEIHQLMASGVEIATTVAAQEDNLALNSG
jgi:hypothetical protein